MEKLLIFITFNYTKFYSLDSFLIIFVVIFYILNQKLCKSADIKLVSTPNVNRHRTFLQCMKS